MHFLKNKILSLLNGIFEEKFEELKFLSGQSAINASRSRYSALKNLWDAEVKVYSQWGEDGIIDYLCETLEISKPKILEIGAGNFTECNSRFASEFRNASVFAVDGRSDLLNTIEESPLKWKTHLFAENYWVDPNNVSQILSRANSAMAGIDILSLDLDGNDYWILEAMDLTGISVVVVEYNALFGATRSVSVPRKDDFNRVDEHWSWLYYGASLKSFINLLGSKGFTFVGTNRVGNNAFFVCDSKVSAFPLKASKDISQYTDWRIRESRNLQKSLSFTDGAQRNKLMSDMPLIDTETLELLTVLDLG
jgi:hypothetical protein